MYKVILILNKFFLKSEGWEWGVGCGVKLASPQKKLPSKSPALLQWISYVSRRINEQQKCMYLYQISTSSEFVGSILQKWSLEKSFWLVNAFWNWFTFLNVAGNQRYVAIKNNRWKFFEQSLKLLKLSLHQWD